MTIREQLELDAEGGPSWHGLVLEAIQVTPEQYGELCDIVERAWHQWPVDSYKDEAVRHTSDYARAAARRILVVLGLEAASG